jgi:Asp-tRNA(Asn)/Glu-tRNA(Gln) amidotransferase B subunit
MESDVQRIIRELHLQRIVDPMILETLAYEAIVMKPQAASDFQQGKDRALNVLVGHVMAQTKNCADAPLVTKILREALGRPC